MGLKSGSRILLRALSLEVELRDSLYSFIYNVFRASTHRSHIILYFYFILVGKSDNFYLKTTRYKLKKLSL